MIWDNFSIFRTNCAIACGTRAHMLRGFLGDVAQGKWHPRFTKFMLLAHNSTRLCLLEFGLSIFVVSCSSSEIRQCRIYVCPALSLSKWCSAASFTRTGDPKSRNDGTEESRNSGITERRKITLNPKRRNRGITERRKIPPNPKRRNRGITERRKIPPNPKRRNDGKSPKFLKDGIT